MALRSKLPHVGTTIFTEMTLLANRFGAVNLGQGMTDFDGPEALRAALTEAMASGANQYAPMPGLATLREQVAKKVQRFHGRAVDPDTEVTITSGGTEALFAAIAALVDTGDEVILLDPCYDSYDPAVRLQGAVPVHVPLDPATFAPDWDRIAAACTPHTRMIVINSPHNPTGAVFTAADLQALAALAEARDLVVLSDEVYEHITFNGEPHQSVSRLPGLAARSVVVGSFGKTFHCTGWKVGTLVAPAALTTELRKVHQYLTFCTFHPAQVALARILAEDPAHIDALPAFFQAKRDFFRALLAQTPLRPLPVGGGFFQVADYSALRDEDDRAFCHWLTEVGGVTAIPLSAFYETPYSGQRLVRFCFAKREATLEAAAERLRKL